MTIPPETASHPPVGARTVRRIGYLIPGFGLAAALIAMLLRKGDWTEGLIAGSALAWINFHWLKRGVEAVTLPSGNQAGLEKPRRHLASYVVAVFRYVLIGAAVYVIFNYLHVPLLSIALGLCAFVAATIVASVWEILQTVR